MGKVQTILPIPVPVITDKEGRYLLVYKEYARSTMCCTRWQLPGGTMKFGQSIKEALIEKVKDYVNLEIVPEKVYPYIPTVIADDAQGEYEFVVIPMTAHVVGGNIFPKKGKIREVQWFTYEEVRKLNSEGQLAEKDLDIINFIRANG